MKHIRLIVVAGALVAFASCSKKLSIDPLSFAVTTSSTTYHVGDTVHFNFTGNPDFISFYSGEDGNDYANHDRTTADGAPQLQFTSYAQYGTQQNTLQLMVSNDFSGTYDAANISKASWTDVTDRATLSTGADNTPSGIIDLSDILAQKKPVFIAFKYTGTSGSTQKTWTLKNLTLNLLKTNNKILPVTDMASAGWKQVSLANSAAVWSISASQLRIAGGNATADDNEDWVISKLLYLNNVAPDVSIPIKNITQNVNSFDYVFSDPGTYKVVFLAANATADEQQSTTKEIDLTIQ
ncbi:MAG: DUF5017 domain-containing protein [Ginsengibacter sp.]